MLKAMKIRRNMGERNIKSQGVVEGERKKEYMRKERKMGRMWKTQRR